MAQVISQKIYHKKTSNTNELQQRKCQLLIHICKYILSMQFSCPHSRSDIVTACQYTLQFTKTEDIMSAPDNTYFVGSEEM